MDNARQVAFYRHHLGDAEKARIVAALDDPILTTGRATREAEQRLATYLDVPHVVCLDSCTAALHLALVASDIGPGDEVIVPAMTFVATATAVLMCGATPVFADVDPVTACMTPATTEARLTPRTRALIPVHLYGLLCDMEGLRALADRHGLQLIEDSAHCLEARRGVVRPGSLGDAACLSFYATKNITCGEGGALATHDAELAERVRRLSLHGMTTSAYERYHRAYRHWDVPQWGWKYNLDNLRASLLLPQIERLDERWSRRQQIARRYESAFEPLDGVEFPRVTHASWSARHLFTIWVDPARRDEILDGLQRRGVGVAVNYRAVHKLTWFAENGACPPGGLPVSESIGERTISLPLYPQLTAEDMDHVIHAVAETVHDARPQAVCHCA
jgi:UDP-4-amino-4-deoxy-L-arabinose-oxoglutarate aminotransferase